MISPDPFDFTAMDALTVVHARCCGIDVHKETVVACVRSAAGPGGAPANEVRTFGTTTKALLELGDWLAERWQYKRGHS